ncbi:hypothetical protein EELLY_v1c00070 [Entomoplasma ellychniae]|uniref:Uncharacterized protein n=1 Tax=Entomoplasma ellychniae TaxID=2114 RepID=A0A8E2QWR3_9MOLU|nr:hypothetical protein [Entomoplasma ellychniae]PPE04333.1 hypothetical protein EELLY_v1c00070 [Entomoplasma ellychniae]
MKTQIKQLKLKVLIMLIIEALITLVIITWSSLTTTSNKVDQDIILFNFMLGYIIFLLHLMYFFLKRKAMIKHFKVSIENKQIFSSYIFKRIKDGKKNFFNLLINQKELTNVLKSVKRLQKEDQNV